MSEQKETKESPEVPEVQRLEKGLQYTRGSHDELKLSELALFPQKPVTSVYSETRHPSKPQAHKNAWKEVKQAWSQVPPKEKTLKACINAIQSGVPFRRLPRIMQRNSRIIPHVFKHRMYDAFLYVPLGLWPRGFIWNLKPWYLGALRGSRPLDGDKFQAMLDAFVGDVYSMECLCQSIRHKRGLLEYLDDAILGSQLLMINPKLLYLMRHKANMPTSKRRDILKIPNHQRPYMRLHHWESICHLRGYDEEFAWALQWLDCESPPEIIRSIISINASSDQVREACQNRGIEAASLALDTIRRSIKSLDSVLSHGIVELELSEKDKVLLAKFFPTTQ